MKKYKAVILILIFASVLRFWKLSVVPPSLTQDEAALGYNAYSILKTGKDEYGKFLPVIFKSFGDYKPGLYIYLDVPFVATLGLNEASTRLPSAIAGVFSVLLIYLICRRLFDEKVGALAAFISAVNPWLIYFSRGAWEANVALTLTLAGIYFFIRSFSKNMDLIWSCLFFGLTLLTYQGAKLSTAIVFVILVVVYWKDLIRISKRYIASSLIVGVLIISPILLSLFNSESGRLEVFSIFSYPRPVGYTQAFLDEGREKIGSVSYYLFHSEALNFARGILGRYFNNFSGKFLFFEGDYQNPQHSAPYQGMLFLGDIILLPFGFFVMAKRKLNKESLFILLWLVLSPLPAVLTRDQVQSVRDLGMAVPLIVVLSFGLLGILEWIGRQKYTLLYYLLLTACYLFGFVYFLDAYFVHLPVHNSKYWNYGYKQIIDFVTPIQHNYTTVKVQQSFTQPYIYFLYYQKYDPIKYQYQAKLALSANPNDVGLISRLDNIEFTQLNWSVDRNDKNTLLVGDPISLPESIGMLDEIKYLDERETAFKVVETR